MILLSSAHAPYPRPPIQNERRTQLPTPDCGPLCRRAIDSPDGNVARRTRLTAQITRRMNDAALRHGRAQARRILEETYSEARAAARSGDFAPAEALLEFLKTYIPALCSCRAEGSDWTAMSRRLQEMRVFRATKILCFGGDAD